MSVSPTSSSRLELTVGEVSHRSGVPVSTLHFYESKGLIHSRRTEGNQRRYHRGVLRRVAVIKVAQRAGIPLTEIREAFSTLPADHAPDAADWERLSRHWHSLLAERIRQLTRLRDQFDSCIGCGCLSLKDCPLRNPGDAYGRHGAGPHLLAREALED